MWFLTDETGRVDRSKNLSQLNEATEDSEIYWAVGMKFDMETHYEIPEKWNQSNWHFETNTFHTKDFMRKRYFHKRKTRLNFGFRVPSIFTIVFPLLYDKSIIIKKNLAYRKLYFCNRLVAVAGGVAYKIIHLLWLKQFDVVSIDTFYLLFSFKSEIFFGA